MKEIHPIVIDDFKALLSEGLSMVVICNRLKISRATYYRYVKMQKESESAPAIEPKPMAISFERYYNAVMSGNFRDKSELAELLGVSRATLFECENMGYLERLAQLLRLKRWPLDDIKVCLGVKSDQRVMELIGEVMPIDEIKGRLETAKNLAAQCNEVDLSLTTVWVNLSNVINKLDEVQKIMEQ